MVAETTCHAVISRAVSARMLRVTPRGAVIFWSLKVRRQLLSSKGAAVGAPPPPHMSQSAQALVTVCFGVTFAPSCACWRLIAGHGVMAAWLVARAIAGLYAVATEVGRRARRHSRTWCSDRLVFLLAPGAQMGRTVDVLRIGYAVEPPRTTGDLRVMRVSRFARTCRSLTAHENGTNQQSPPTCTARSATRRFLCAPDFTRTATCIGCHPDAVKANRTAARSRSPYRRQKRSGNGSRTSLSASGRW